jgi:hypothetical protein
MDTDPGTTLFLLRMPGRSRLKPNAVDLRNQPIIAFVGQAFQPAPR